MINHKSLEAVKGGRWSQGRFSRPLYESYSFSKIPGTLQRLLGVEGDALPQDCWRGDKYDSVVLFLIDGFGWEFLEKHHAKYPFLARFFREGLVSQLTSQFPSTTAAHITTLCSGEEVGQTGIYEWYMYEPLLDRVIAPLLYSFAGDHQTSSLKEAISPEKIFPEETLFQKLAKKGIASTVYQHESIAHSMYSNWMFRGSTFMPFRKFSEGLSSLGDQVSKGGLFYIYFGDIDAEAHRHGMDSEPVKKAMDHCFQTLERCWEELSKLSNKVACIVTADHGMTAIDPKTTYFLNQKIPELEKCFCKGQNGRPLTPAGSCRDYFLHLLPEKMEEAQELLQKELEGQALICKTAQLIEEGFFGSKAVLPAFLSRVGNLVILPYENNSVWWYEKGRFEQKFHAMHGGLTPPEMETIFLFASNL